MMGVIKHHLVSICDCGHHAFAAMSSPFTVMVSPEDRNLLDDVWWTVTQRGIVCYAQSGRRKEKPRYLHQRVFKPTEGCEVDHDDGNGLNCTRGNLRSATKSQNQRNQRARKIVKLKGVKFYAWKPIPKPYSARIFYDGKTEHLGSFAKAEEAALAYDAAARARFGQFARTNFP